MSKESEFDFAPPEVDEQIFDAPQERTPAFIWHGKQESEAKYGYWSIRPDSFDMIPGGFEEREIRFGGPAEPLQTVYVTQRLRFAPVAVRRRKTIIEAGTLRKFHYPLYTRRDDMVKGQLKQSTQIMGFVLDDTTPRMIALGGYSKGMFWDNDEKGQYGKADWPRGVWQLLGDYANKATAALREKASGPVAQMPRLCAWWVDLIPWIDPTEGGPGIVNVSPKHNIYMSPFVADMGVAKKLALPGESRFTGPLFDDFQSWRREHGLTWEGEWKELEIEEVRPGQGGSNFNDQDWKKAWDDTDAEMLKSDQGWTPGTAAAQEEDEIPF